MKMLIGAFGGAVLGILTRRQANISLSLFSLLC
jgi:hypothetical protein